MKGEADWQQCCGWCSHWKRYREATPGEQVGECMFPQEERARWDRKSGPMLASVPEKTALSTREDFWCCMFKRREVDQS